LVIDIYIKLKNIMKKIIRMTESDLTRLVKRVIQEQALVSQLTSVDNVKPTSQAQAQLKIADTAKLLRSVDTVKPSSKSAENPTSSIAKTTTQSDDVKMRQGLDKLIGIGRGFNYEEICNFCKQQKNLETNNPRAKKAAREFAQAIKGLENPLSNFGGYTNEKSSAVQAGQALERNLKTATDICTMIQYYSYPSYGGTQEEFCEAVGGELKGKFDASTNFSELFGLPFYRIVNKVGYKPISEY
jgi:hypothetical protein